MTVCHYPQIFCSTGNGHASSPVCFYINSDLRGVWNVYGRYGDFGGRRYRRSVWCSFGGLRGYRGLRSWLLRCTVCGRALPTSAAGDIAVLVWCSFGGLRGFRGLRSGRVRCLWTTVPMIPSASDLGGRRYRRFLSRQIFSSSSFCEKVAWHMANVINPTFSLMPFPSVCYNYAPVFNSPWRLFFCTWFAAL